MEGHGWPVGLQCKPQSQSLSSGVWTWIWDVGLELGFETWIWDLGLGLGLDNIKKRRKSRYQNRKN